MYLRISTTRAEQEHGLAAQLHACKEFLARQGIAEKDVIVYEEKASGRKTDRPVLRKLLHEAALHRFTNLLTFKLDRLSRGGIGPTFQLLKNLHDAGVRVYSVTESWWDPDNPVHEVTLAVLAWGAQLESKAIGERVSAGIQARKRESERKGVPFLWGRALTSPLRHDTTMPRRAVELREAGLSWGKLARTLGISRTSARRLHQLGLASRPNGTEAGEATAKNGPRAS